MSVFPAQTITVPEVQFPDADVEAARLRLREAHWWALWPGDDGYQTPLHEYLGMTLDQWRAYAISARRAW